MCRGPNYLHTSKRKACSRRGGPQLSAQPSPSQREQTSYPTYASRRALQLLRGVEANSQRDVKCPRSPRTNRVQSATVAYRSTLVLGLASVVREQSNHFGSSQFCDLVSIETELSEHLLGLLTEFRRRRHHLARGA
jgi:hypothetical protein